MPQFKLTKLFCDGKQPPAVGGVLPPGEYSDVEVRGFQLRVLPSGKRQFAIRYRVGGRKARLSLGDYGVLTVEQARKLAQQKLAEVAMGGDPSNARAEARRAWTVRQLVDHYKSEVLSRRAPKTRESYLLHLDHHILPALGKRPAAAVTSAEVLQMFRAAARSAHREDADGKVLTEGTTTANRVLATTSVLFAEAVSQGLRTDNPCASIKRYPERKRERHLSADELARVLVACEQSPHTVAANLLRLLMVTGARKGETMNAKWDQFDLDAALWTKPSHMTKQKRQHTVTLSPLTVTLLQEMKAANDAGSASIWLFPGRDASKPVVSIKRSISAILAAAGFGDEPSDRRVTPHTLRHSFATQAVSSGASLRLVGQLLGHTQAATTQRYAHAEQNPLREVGLAVDAGLREASDRLRQREAEAAELARLGDNVVAMPARKAG